MISIPVNSTFTAELDLKFLPEKDFESTTGLSDNETAPVLVRNLLRLLMMGWTESWTSLISLSVLHAVFIERNSEYLREMRAAFQKGFYELFKQLKDQNFTLEQAEQIQLYLSNCLSLLPYSDLTPYEFISIPQCIDGQWEMVEYTVKPIELTDGYLLDSDRVFAYGLAPMFQRKAESHLIFMGTTYPAGQGFIPQVKTDSKGFESVGKTLYRSGRAKIHQWLEAQPNTIRGCGTSLGGSLCLLLATDRGNYRLSRVDALNPAGLHDAWSKSRFDYWDELTYKPQVIVQKQGNDPVSYFGLWKKDWEILHVVPPSDKKGPNGIWDHILNYAGLKGTQLTSIDPELDNATRSTRNFWLFSVGRGALYYCLMVPYYYLIRPIGYFLLKNWPLLILLPALGLNAHLALSGFLTGVALIAIATTLVFAIAAVVGLGIVNMRSLPYAKLHDPKLPRVKENDLYDPDNEINIELQYKEINAYYKIMRCFLKNKQFIPADERSSKCVANKSKKTLLEESENSGNAETPVTLKVTKAKAVHIWHTLSLFEKHKNKDEAQRKQILQETYAEYRIGKHVL
jgi:hypothetical protein